MCNSPPHTPPTHTHTHTHTHSYCRCCGVYSVNSIRPSSTLLDLSFHLLLTGEWIITIVLQSIGPCIARELEPCNPTTVLGTYTMLKKCASNPMHEFCPLSSHVAGTLCDWLLSWELWDCGRICMSLLHWLCCVGEYVQHSILCFCYNNAFYTCYILVPL